MPGSGAGDDDNGRLIARPERVCGAVSKSEREAAVFRRGSFGIALYEKYRGSGADGASGCLNDDGKGRS